MPRSRRPPRSAAIPWWPLPASLPDVPCIHVSAPEDATATHGYVVPHVALAIAHALRSRGRDVVVLVDRLDAWLRFARMRGDANVELARLSSRAYLRGAGSVTLLARGAQRPYGLAFDRVIALADFVGHPRSSAPLRVPDRHMLWAACRAALAGDVRARALLGYRPGMPVDLVEQFACVLAGLAVPELPIDRLDAWLAVLRRDHGPRLAQIRARGGFDGDDERVLIAVARGSW